MKPKWTYDSTTTIKGMGRQGKIQGQVLSVLFLILLCMAFLILAIDQYKQPMANSHEASLVNDEVDGDGSAIHN